jgi:hypothetical protein
MEHPVHLPIHFPSASAPVARLGYLPVHTSIGLAQPDWSIDRLLKSNGVSAIIIASLIFLTVYAWVDAFSQWFRDNIPPSQTPIPDTVGLQQLPGQSQPRPRIPHRLPESGALNFKWKLIYALILTVVTVIVCYILLVLWKRFSID